MTKLTITHEFTGYSDFWSGNGRRWDNDAGCLFAYYGAGTTLSDCVEQWCDEFCMGSDCDDFPADIDSDDLCAAILESLTEQGRADYEADALAECAIEYANDNDISENDENNDYDEHPVWIILVECYNEDK